jgi:dimethylaniline monooxygenase (N-oxide forming)
VSPRIDAKPVDPFGLRAAVSGATKRRSWLWRLVARLVDHGLSAMSLVPLVLIGLAVLSCVWSPGNPVYGVLAFLGLLWGGGFIIDTLRLIEPRPRPEAPPKANTGRVAVIGAGPVGLAVTKECLAAGLEVVCFERQTLVGGVYLSNDTYLGGVWDGVRLTTSPWVTAFSDLPPESNCSRQLDHAEYCAYLERYVSEFSFADRIKLGHVVVRAKLRPDGTWSVRHQSVETQVECDEVFDHLVVCTGLNLKPKPVAIPGQDMFTGTVSHVASYRDARDYTDQDVVVVGIGESGADIAAELMKVARPRLSMRRGKFIIPRINPLNGVANDYDTNRTRYAPPVAVRNSFMTFKRRLCLHTGDITPASAVRARLLELSGVGPMSQTVTKNDAIISGLLDGSLELRRAISHLDGDHVVYEDGFREQVDAVLFAHGYRPSFPFLDLGDQATIRHPGQMYLNMVHPDVSERLFFCGFARPAVGAIPPTGELQARYVVQCISGRRSLPSSSDMERDILLQSERLAALYPAQEQPHVVVSWIDYMDRLAGAIGCRPDPRQLLRRPWLGWKVATGPVTGALYRLHGPGASRVAESTVLSLPRMHQIRELVTHIGLYLWTWPVAKFTNDPNWKSANTIW